MKAATQPDWGGKRRRSGIALIIVLVVIIALTVLAAGFSYAMKVEMRLAQTANVDEELEWIGRSGVEYARYILGQQLAIAAEPYDSLNQKWAGGPGGLGTTNSPLQDIVLMDVPLGEGRFSIKIEDLERRININIADQILIQQALIQIGVDASLFPVISDSILDWIDRDDDPHLSGAASDYYMTLKPAYVSKNGPVDDLSELLMVKGITPRIYWGSRFSSHENQGLMGQNSPWNNPDLQTEFSIGLVDLFSTLSARFVNINTASAEVLQMIPPIDSNTAAALIRHRSGPDGIEGNEDDNPFRTVNELVNVPGFNSEFVASISQRGILSNRSATFEVTISAEFGAAHREFRSIIRRVDSRNLLVLSFLSI